MPGGLGAEGDPIALLRMAAEEVRLEWEPVLKESYEEGEVGWVMGWLVEGVDALARDQEVAAPTGNLTLTRFLLERLSSAVTTAIAATPQMGRESILHLLKGVDAMRRRVEPEWDRYFHSQISGPDGLGMVTEVLHDLRSPLTSIRCLAELMEREQSGPISEIQRKQLRLIYSAALGIGSMATDVIEMARQGDQLPDSQPEPFSVGEVLEGVAQMVRPIAEEKGLLMQFGSLHSDSRVGMPHALGRVLLNLVTNALKFTDEGRVDVLVRAVTPTKVEFAVVDTGRGIPEAAIPHLFRPFRRTTGRPGRSGYMFSGTGLGLGLCRKLVRAMGSELKFETTSGQGTRFSFELELPLQSRL